MGEGRPDPGWAEERIRRLERRLERERLARQQAEDIAERHLRDLYLLNQDLDRKVNERTVELLRARAAAERAAAAKTRFLSTISHEVRTPLNAILGTMTSVEREQVPYHLRESFDIVAAGADDLNRLLGDLLTIAELGDAEDTRPALVALDDIAAAIRSAWQILAARRGLLLVVRIDSPERTVTIDGSRLLEIIGRLIDNAVKFATAGEVEVRLSTRTSVTEEEGSGATGTPPTRSWVEVEVHDQGPGFGPGFRPLTEAFGREDETSTRSTAGSGLGLSVSRILAEGMGGRIGLRRGFNRTIAWVSVPQVG